MSNFAVSLPEVVASEVIAPEVIAPEIIAPEIIAIVPAAGIGSRMQADCPKQYLIAGARPSLNMLFVLCLATHEFSGLLW